MNSGPGRRLEGKKVLVTGAASGIGRAISSAMASEGARVAAHARSLEKTAAIVSEIREAGGQAFGVAADLTDPAAGEAMCRDGLERLGSIDIVVNNAGLFGVSNILDMDDDYWDLNFKVHVTAPMLITRCIVRTMIAQGRGGCLIYIGSTSSTEPDPDWVAYASSKHAVVGFMKAAAAAFGKHRIRSNAIAPAWVDTPMARRYFHDLSDQTGEAFDTLYESETGTGPLNAHISAGDIADLAVFLASDSGRHISGQTLSVCGGQVMR